MINSNIKPDIIAFTSLIDGHCKTNNLSKAEELFDKMMKEHIKPDVSTFTS